MFIFRKAQEALRDWGGMSHAGNRTILKMVLHDISTLDHTEDTLKGLIFMLNEDPILTEAVLLDSDLPALLIIQAVEAAINCPIDVSICSLVTLVV